MTDWTTIQQELNKQAPRTRAGSPEAFWQDFSARARLTVQEPAPQPQHSRSAIWASLAMAGAVALLTVILWSPAAVAEATRVTSLEVGPPCTGSMILNVVSKDGRNTGALVWVSGLEETYD